MYDYDNKIFEHSSNKINGELFLVCYDAFIRFFSANNENALYPLLVMVHDLVYELYGCAAS